MTRKEELEARLAQHRRQPAKNNELGQRLEQHRIITPAAQEKESRLSKYGIRDEDFGYHGYLSEVVGGGALAAREVRPAVAFATGILSLDIALGGGLPAGVVEIYGAESVGKTTLMDDIIGSAQSQGRFCALVPTEMLDQERAVRIGVNLEELLLIREKGERALELAEYFILEDDGRALFIDSFTGMRPDQDQFSAWCEMLVRWFERVAGKMGPRSCIVMTNQVRARRSLDPRKFFAGGTDSAARRAASYFDTRMELTRENVTDDDFDLVINVVANLLSAPHKIVTLHTHKVDGIDVWRDVVRVAVQRGVMEQKGSWFYFNGSPIAQGEDMTARTLQTTPTGTVVFQETLRVLS